MPWNCLCASSDEKPKLEISAPILKVGDTFTLHASRIKEYECVVTFDLFLPEEPAYFIWIPLLSLSIINVCLFFV